MAVGAKFFICTNTEHEKTILFKCKNGEPTPVQIFPSESEPRLREIPEVIYCCRATCCQWGRSSLLGVDNQNFSLTETGIEPIVPKVAGGQLVNLPQHEEDWEHASILTSPHFWTAIVVAILACALVVQNVISYKRSRAILPTLEREANGPYSTTREGSGGIILPELVYTRQLFQPVNERSPAKIKQIKESGLEVLSASDLMELDFNLSKDKSDVKILSEEGFQKVSAQSPNPEKKRASKKVILVPHGTGLPVQNPFTVTVPRVGVGPVEEPLADALDPRRKDADDGAQRPADLQRPVTGYGPNLLNPPSGVGDGDQRLEQSWTFSDYLGESVSIDRAVIIPIQQVAREIDLPGYCSQDSDNNFEGHVSSSETCAIALPRDPDGGLKLGPSKTPEASPAGALSAPHKIRADSDSLSPPCPEDVEAASDVDQTRHSDKKFCPDADLADSFSIITTSPLVPAYHPHRRVSEVWREDNSMERLYRYTHIDRLVYPPGFIT